MLACDHEPRIRRVCRHLLDDAEPPPHVMRFTGRGNEFDRVCRGCVEHPGEMTPLCATCDELAGGGGLAGFHGAPEIREVPSACRFEHRELALPRGPVTRALEAQPITDGDRDLWVIAGDDGRLHELAIDHAGCALTALAEIPRDHIDLAQPVIVRLSRDHALAVIANRHGSTGAVIDLATGATVMALARDGYHAEHCTFPLAFFERGGRQLLVHATAWNRLEITDPRTGEQLVSRPDASRDDPESHHLDYFHCELAISPDQRHIADNGWVWHPVGITTAWSLERWLVENRWESEDGPTRQQLCYRDYYWDGPWCWIDDTHLGVWGYGNDSDAMLDAVCIIDVTTGRETRWFPGPAGELFCTGGLLLGVDAKRGAAIWDVATGARLHADPAATSYARFHPGARTLLALGEGGVLRSARLRGQAAAWCRGPVAELAVAIARDRSWDGLGVLADALEEAGCTDAALVAHCRAAGAHGDRCWALDALT